VKEYTVDGVSVRSEITRDVIVPESGQRAVSIVSSCPSERWGTRTQGYGCTFPPNHSEFAVDLELARLRAAEMLLKVERGELPEGGLRVLGIEVFPPQGNGIRMIAGVNLATPATLLGPEILESPRFGFTRLGKYTLQNLDGSMAEAPLYGVRIKYGSYDIETYAVVSYHGSPACILGGDFFQKILRGKEYLIQELVADEHQRLLATAARCKKRYVLLAGSYGSHRGRLDGIKSALRSIGLVGLVLDEYPDIEEQSLAEKMVTYAAVSRFVIVDDFVPSGHIDELAICHERKFITAVLRLGGRATTAMQADLADDVTFIKEFAYAGDDELEVTALQAANWANGAVAERAKSLNRRYSAWRSPEKIVRG